MDINWVLENPYFITVFECYVNTYVWVMDQDIVKWINSYNYAKCTEPVELEWSSICSLIYQSKYDICYTYDNYPPNIQSEYGRFYVNRENKYGFCSEKNRNETDIFEVLEHLFAAKQNEKYFIRTYFTGHKPLVVDVNTNTKSEVEFIYVEYRHPKMSTPIELKIPSGMYMIGNELFTPAFVLRQLQHQGEYYCFDMDYTLKIIDSSVVEVTLESNQYIVIKPEEYSILLII